MRSVVVVLPASMWAMMPMLRTLSSGYCRSIYCFPILPSDPLTPCLSGYSRFHRLAPGLDTPSGGSAAAPTGGHRRGVPTPLRRALPAVVGERLVGFGHPVGILPLLDRGPPVVGRIQELGGEPLLHGLLGAVPREPDDPAHRQRGSPLRAHLDRHLIRGPADPPRLHLEGRLDVVHGLL